MRGLHKRTQESGVIHMCGECPCKDCEDRVFNCHQSCKKYSGWSSERERQRAEYKEKYGSNSVVQSSIDSRFRYMRRSGLMRYSSMSYSRRYGNG